jgi:hypothetical protein
MILGYGTEYEKFILKGIARRICQKYRIKSSQQLPQNNLLGQAEIFPILKDCQNPDLVWNFCDFENQRDTDEFFKKIFSLNPRYVLVITQNHYNPGVLIHLVYHCLTRRKWNHGDFRKMSSYSVSKIVKNHRNLKVVETGAFDVPWFILDVYETGKYFRHLPLLKEGTKEIRRSKFEDWPLLFKMFFGHHHFVLLEKTS